MALLTSLPALTVTALAAVAMTGCSISVDLDRDTMRRVEDESIPLGQIESIAITTENGQIDVIARDVAAVEVRAVMVESDAGDAAYTIERATVGDAERLVIAGECDARRFDPCTVGFRVVIPAQLDVDVATDNGRIDVDGVAGELDIDTDNGAIEAEALISTDVTAHTDNGRIELSFTSAPSAVDAETDNGRIVVRVPEPSSYAVDAATDNGAVDIDVTDDDGADRTIRARSDNGSIDIGYALDT